MGGGGGWIDQSADCPEAGARHGQTGSGGSWWVISRWGVEVIDRIELTDQSADCPEARRPATVRLEVLIEGFIEVY